MVIIGCELLRRIRPEETRVFGVLRHRFRLARATDMTIEAQHAIAARHDDVQIVGDQEYAEFALIAQIADQLIEIGFTGVVDAARWLIQNKQVRIT